MNRYLSANMVMIAVYLIGIAGFAFEPLRPVFARLTPIVLWAGTFTVILLHQPLSRSFLLFSAIIFLLGLGVEITGVNTGIIFGSYQYSGTLGPEIFSTPFLMGALWLQLTYSIIVITHSIFTNFFIRCLAGGFLLTIYDFILEPAALLMNWWKWENNRVPLQNYWAWFITGFLLTMLYDEQAGNTRNVSAIVLLGLQIMFFLAVNLIL